jgi:hypothetical protein
VRDTGVLSPSAVWPAVAGMLFSTKTSTRTEIGRDLRHRLDAEFIKVGYRSAQDPGSGMPVLFNDAEMGHV